MLLITELGRAVYKGLSWSAQTGSSLPPDLSSTTEPKEKPQRSWEPVTPGAYVLLLEEGVERMGVWLKG
jgi:hypothetical protein